MRDQDGRLAGWGLPHDHFETNISNFVEPQPEEVPEVKYPQSYQAMFGGTPRTLHMNRDGAEFVYFNHGSKAFERVKISPAHAHAHITDREKSSLSTSETNSYSTSEIGLAADIRDACTNCFTATINTNAACLNPG
jgi:hypothetical protein